MLKHKTWAMNANSVILVVAIIRELVVKCFLLLVSALKALNTRKMQQKTRRINMIKKNISALLNGKFIAKTSMGLNAKWREHEKIDSKLCCSIKPRTHTLLLFIAWKSDKKQRDGTAQEHKRELLQLWCTRARQHEAYTDLH